jgi:hypothetical protein
MYRTQLPTEDVPGSAAEGILGANTPAVSTPWIEYDGQYSGECMASNGTNVLMAHGEEGVPALKAYPDARWGLHVDDPNLVMGNLVSLVHTEIASYVAARVSTAATS